MHTALHSITSAGKNKNKDKKEVKIQLAETGEGRVSLAE